MRASNSYASKRSWRLSIRVLALCSLLTIVGFSSVCAIVLVDMRSGEESLALQSSQNLAATIDSDLSRNLELYDLSLRAVVNNLRSEEIVGVSKQLRQLILFDHAATARHFGAIEVLDPNGDLIIDSSTLNPLKENKSDEEFFAVHRDGSDVDLFISRPRLYRGSYAIVLSRRITAADGKFLGVVAGSIRFSYFHNLFEQLHLDPDDRISVIRHDGVLIMRTPFDLDLIGRDFSSAPGVKEALSKPEGGSLWSRGIVDGVQRLFVWPNSSKPLMVMVGKSRDSIYALWQREALRIGATLLALMVLTVGAALFLAREMRERAKAEQRLAELATTDGLTKLHNRRKFEEAIEGEWRRASRQGTPLALLMIDADRFKRYNDSYGHPAGDAVLMGIASCIAASAHRAGDCAVRYGGEEFAVLLPGLTVSEAMHVAEAMRKRVEDYPFEFARMTVSIGIASLIPVGSSKWTNLVSAADQALYTAKNRGRNQTATATLGQLIKAA